MCTTESWLRLLCNGEHGFFNNAEILLLWRVARVRVKAKKYFWPSLCCFFVFLWFHPSLMQPSIQAQVCVYCSSCPEVVNLCWWGGDRVKHRSQNTRSGRYWSMNTLLLYWHKFSKYLYFTTKYLFFGQLSNLYFFSPHSDTHIFTFTPYIFHNRLISLVLTHYRLFKTLRPKC